MSDFEPTKPWPKDLSEWPALRVNVLDFGAKGDGKTDDQPATQEAINHAMRMGSFATKDANGKITVKKNKEAFSTNGGAIVYFPPGMYKIGSPIKLFPTGGTGFRNSGLIVHLEGHQRNTIIFGDNNGFKNETDRTFGLIEWDFRFPFEILDDINFAGSTKPAEWDGKMPALEIPSNMRPMTIGEQYKALSSEDDQIKLMKSALEMIQKFRKQIQDTLGFPHMGFNRTRNQSIRNLTLALPENTKAHGLYKRWPFPLELPEIIAQVIIQTRNLLATKSGDNKWEKLKKTWFDELGAWQGVIKGSREASRLKLNLENINIHGNNKFHQSLMRFEGSVVHSIFRNITAQVSHANDPGKHLKRNFSNETPVPNITIGETDIDIPVAPDFQPNSNDTASTLNLVGKVENDTILFHFDDGPEGDFFSDIVGFQYGIIENVRAGITGGGFICAFRGRINASRFELCFANGALFGPSYDFRNSANSQLIRLLSEGKTDRSIFEFRNCHGLLVDDISLGGPTEIENRAVVAKWSDEAKEASLTLGSGIKMEGCTDCIFRRRWAPNSPFKIGWVQRKINRSTNPEVKFSSPFAMVDLDNNCKRNRFTDFNLNYNDSGKKQASQRSVNFLTQEFELGPRKNLNSVSGWIHTPRQSNIFANDEDANKLPNTEGGFYYEMGTDVSEVKKIKIK